MKDEPKAAALLSAFTNVIQGPWVTAGRDVQFYVKNKTLYIECSKGRSDWKHNFMFGIRPYMKSSIPIFAHRGFTALWLSIKDIIESLDFNSVVAYSQGSGIAHNIHENYVHRFGKEPEYTFAFADPRNYWLPCKKLKSRFNNFYCIRNPRDLVTRLPPYILGYRHVGHSIRLKGKVKRPKHVPWWLWLSGHTPEEYTQRLTCAVLNKEHPWLLDSILARR